MQTFIFKPSNFNLINYGTVDDIYFKAKDIASFLGYVNTKKAIKKHVSKSCKFIKATRGYEMGPHKKDTLFLNEIGLYELIFNSKMETAIQFREWVFKHVLPSIRKTGSYTIKQNIKPNLEFEIHTESDLHKQIVNFCKVNYPHIILIVANGELQNDTREKRIKSFNTGYEAGTFDIIITNYHKDGFTGLAIELKSPKGTGQISDKQLGLKRKYDENNFITLITNDYNKAIIEIIKYMDNTRIKCKYCIKNFKNDITRNIHYKFFHKIIF